ncbi:MULTISPECIES: GNAT family N-acetyltransferase [Streptomyces]|uniref:Acetyltransferase n=1 Tax=Streptomyces sviceus (strain ATCC 29083 / DSM 924 / JCM 4929 / NBRC 13980 / NCIMB 11184 / NRRL 5439 / UC 5370) TaxID=463191 RepID=B5HYY3_STRX2|nr:MULTISPECIES: GNAT family N-acetyltransferase [Streptomyces]EDY58038.1 acetyltransferase [Streptomyces sviceus ATCC 29083]MYT03411.1 GNAT family N-acetyltransferase [Streptomyces sp. SID5470]
MEIRPTTDEDLDVFVDTVHAAFGRFPETPVEGGGLWWSALEMDRCLLALTADGRPVGTAATHSFELTLPGETLVPAPGVTAVGVLPSHRRQGVLSAMMRHQLADLRARGEFLSVLLASEATIYGRFGYGPATYTQRLTVQRHRSVLALPRARATADAPATGPDHGPYDVSDHGPDHGPDRGSVEVLRRSECGEILEDVYDRYRRAQPGALSRPHRWWALRAGQPPISPAPRYVAVHRDADGVPDGYASYSIGEPDNTLTVDETITVDDTVFTALARFVLGHDLASRVVFQHVPPQHPLRWQLADFRAGEVSGDTDWLWVRLLDVPRALTARGWFTDGELVLDVEDPFLGEHGRYLLTVQDGKADCVLTDREPDLSLDVRDLGSVYLGGTAPSTLVRAGHIRAHRPEAAILADALFRTDRAPHCLHWF